MDFAEIDNGGAGPRTLPSILSRARSWSASKATIFAEKLSAKMVAFDADHDLALLRIEGSVLGPAPPLSISAKSINRGAHVAAFGYPLGDAIGSGLKLTSGYV